MRSESVARIGIPPAPTVCIESSKALLSQALAGLLSIEIVKMADGFARGSLGVGAAPARQHRATQY